MVCFFCFQDLINTLFHDVLSFRDKLTVKSNAIGNFINIDVAKCGSIFAVKNVLKCDAVSADLFCI